MTRRLNDFYETPITVSYPLIKEILPFLKTPGYALDVGSGHGALTKEINRQSTIPVKSIEKYPKGIDFLTLEISQILPIFIISNPPYSQAQEFVSRMLLWKNDSNIIAILLRINFLGAQKRHNWWKSVPPFKLRILSTRPSFTYSGTDSTEYAWYVWGLPEISLTIDWYQ